MQEPSRIFTPKEAVDELDGIISWMHYCNTELDGGRVPLIGLLEWLKGTQKLQIRQQETQR